MISCAPSRIREGTYVYNETQVYLMVQSISECAAVHIVLRTSIIVHKPTPYLHFLWQRIL